MAKKKTTTNKKVQSESNRLTAGVSIIIGGSIVIFVGYIQAIHNLKLMIVGFGAAFLVLGAVLVGLSTKSVKQKR